MTMPTLETEVKILVPSFEDIEKRLNQLGAELITDRVHERNVRYDMEDGSLNNRGAVLRLRADNRIRLTYKEPGSIERGIVTREELEVEISDFETMQAILMKFGYMPSMTYEKYRTTYRLDGAEIVLDELPFGFFVEIEGDVESIEDLINELGLANIERRGESYAKLFDYVKHHLSINFNDLTFENFRDISVPENAFIPPGSIVIR